MLSEVRALERETPTQTAAAAASLSDWSLVDASSAAAAASDDPTAAAAAAGAGAGAGPSLRLSRLAESRLTRHQSTVEAYHTWRVALDRSLAARVTALSQGLKQSVQRMEESVGALLASSLQEEGLVALNQKQLNGVMNQVQAQFAARANLIDTFHEAVSAPSPSLSPSEHNTD
jgi:hypothetical protein